MTTPPDPRPTFVVAGAARAGSTAVVEALRDHPDVFVTLPKEPHYLAFAGRPVAFTGPGDDVMMNAVVVTERSSYLDMFAEGEGRQALGEGSVSTLYYADHSIPALQSLNSDVRVVVMLRDPVHRAYSSFQYLSVREFEPLPDFLAAVDDEPRRRDAGWHHLWHYVGMSHYADSLSRFLDAFGDQVGVWFYDDLVAEPEQTVRSIELFIGVDPARAPQLSNRRVNPSGRPRLAALQSAMLWVGRQQVIGDVGRRLVPFRVRERIRAANLAPTTSGDEARSALLPRFKDDLDRLEDLLGRRVPGGWRR